MAELLKIEITKEELTGGILPHNHVLCEAFYSNEELTTASGIIIGFNNDINYQDKDSRESNSRPADMAEVCLIVTKLPSKLYFNPDDRDKSIAWETEQELQIGDLVWTNIIDALNAVTLVCDGRQYKIIPYHDLYCAKRGDTVIMINGYILCEQVYKKSISPLDISSESRIDNAVGLVAFTGSCNKRYVNEDYVDFQDLKKGDLVMFDKKYKPILLERQLYSSKFSQEKLYVVVQRRRISAVINREE